MSLRQAGRFHHAGRAAVVAVAVLLLAVVVVHGTSSRRAHPYRAAAGAGGPGANGASAQRGTIHDHPGGGRRDKVAPSPQNRPVETRKARIEITSVEALPVQAHVPGDVSGPGVAITVRITNRSAGTLNLDAVTVDLLDSEGRSASPVTVDGYAPLSGSFGPGKPATGRYVFTIAPADRDGTEVRITYGPPPEPTVIFTGGLPHA